MFPIAFEIIVQQNRLRVTNLNSGETLDRQAVKSFSTPWSVIADSGILFDALKSSMRALDPSWRRFVRLRVHGQFRIVGPASTDELNTLRAAADSMGFTAVEISTGTQAD